MQENGGKVKGTGEVSDVLGPGIYVEYSEYLELMFLHISLALSVEIHS